MLVDSRPVSFPPICEAVFAVIDTASKTGTDNDATAVTFFAIDKHFGGAPLLILDWDIVQIEGAILESWLPNIFDRLKELARLCHARSGSFGDIHRGQQLRHDFIAASPSTRNAGIPDRIKAHGNGQG